MTRVGTALAALLALLMLGAVLYGALQLRAAVDGLFPDATQGGAR